MTVHASRLPSALVHLQARFLTIRTRIERHARAVFRYVRCAVRQQDLLAETIALCWKWFVRLAEKGKDACRWPLALARYAARAVRSGRRVTGQLKARDVLSEVAQQRHGFYVAKLPDFSTLTENPLAEALADNTRTPPADAAAFRIDWPAWLRRRSRRDRRIIHSMMLSERTTDLARTYQLSPARISQLRREFHADWERFGGGRAGRD
jgi:hypothetical protein